MFEIDLCDCIEMKNYNNRANNQTTEKDFYKYKIHVQMDFTREEVYVDRKVIHRSKLKALLYRERTEHQQLLAKCLSYRSNLISIHIK